MPEHKIVLMGQSGVGKTAIGIRFLQDAFINKYDPTIEDSYRKNVQIDGVHYLVEILDTAGQEQMAAVVNLNWKDGQGYVLVFSITSRASFEVLGSLREKITAVTETENFPCLVVGAKADLNEKREVSTQEARTWASQFEDCSYLEVSAKRSVNVNEVFQQLLQQILEAEANKAPSEEAVEEEEEQATTTETSSTPTQTGGKGKNKKGDCVVQ